MPSTHGEPIFIKGECPQVGCLVIHGFAGVPINEKPILNIMRQYGFTVYAPLLKGHGTDIYDLENASYTDWISDAENAYKKLKDSGCKDILVYGHSLGALLALKLAESEPDIKAVLSFSAPIRVHDFSIYYQWRLPHPRFRPVSFKDKVSAEEYYYEKYPVSKQKDICTLMKDVEKDLDKINCPMLVIQSKNDEVVRTKSAWMICERTNAPRKEVLLLSDSVHNSIDEKENEKMENKIHSFFNNIGYSLLNQIPPHNEDEI